MNHRNIRQSGIIDQAKLVQQEAVIVGCGAIGRQAAIMLATMGIGKLVLIDKDTVNNENLGCQGFWETDIGKPKTIATANACKTINKGVDIEIHESLVMPAEMHPAIKKCKGTVFCCVDSMLARTSVFDNWLDSDAEMMIDGRMSAMTCRCLSMSGKDAASKKHYATSLFPDSERVIEPCTAKSTFFTANIIAGMMVTMWVNQTFLGMSFMERDVALNIPAFLFSYENTDDFILEDDPEGTLQSFSQQQPEEPEPETMTPF